MDASSSQGPLQARALLRWQFRVAHESLEGAIDSLIAEPNFRRPDAIASSTTSVGACYAQIVLSEDICVNGVLSAGTPLALSTWAGRTGLSEIPALVDSSNWRTWTRRVRLDFGELRPYARAVYASTDAYLAELTDDALQPPEKMPACVLNALLLTLSMRRGEIECLNAIDG
jgi:hypothetical protein